MRVILITLTDVRRPILTVSRTMTWAGDDPGLCEMEKES